MKQATPVRVIDYIQEAYQRYYDSAFWMRDECIMAERREMLQTPGVMAQEPLLEAVPQYPSGEEITSACRRAGLGDETAKKLGPLVFGTDASIKLRQHQASALVTALAGDGEGHRNVVVTSGTGSGKTESFLLPLLAGILDERAGGASLEHLHPWWEVELDRHAKTWSHSRSRAKAEEDSATRAMVLYPTNALVEDQISRIRRSAIRAREELGRPLFYFGRYTGATLGGTFFPPDNLKASDRGRVNEVAREIKKIAREAVEIRRTLEASGQDDATVLEACSQFQDPYSGEMLTRWDMISAPPDILITNTSMLNIMLLRDVEAPIFEKTRGWLQSNTDKKFTLVVDELHSYRGTQGTEVALVVRNLLDRLGLAPDSPQLRCIATSASLDGAAGLEYLEQFFGVDRSTFAIYPGEPRDFDVPLPIDASSIGAEADALLSDDPVIAAEASARVCGVISPRTILASGCKFAGKTVVQVGSGGTTKDIIRPAKLTAIKDAIFGVDAPPKLLDALLIAARNEDRGTWDAPKPTFRSHMFLRQVQGVWACSNPGCSEVAERFRSPMRRIGRLFKSPALKCGCGGHVLELLYCYDCGEAFLGGFVVRSRDDRLKDFLFLEATNPVEGGSGPGMVYERPHEEFRWYWPGGRVPLGSASWTHSFPNGKGSGTFQFQAARLDHVLGQLVSGDPNPTGVAMAVPPNLPDNLRVAGLPETCPHCLSSNSFFNQRDLQTFYSGIVETPIRGLRTGLNATTQLIADRAMLAVGDGISAEKMIAFTDSRDDAADLAAGLELHHFRDLVRQLVYRALTPGEVPTSTELRAIIRDVISGDPDSVRKRDAAEKATPGIWAAVRNIESGMAEPREIELASKHNASVESGAVSWPAMLVELRNELVGLGQNPAGTAASRRTDKRDGDGTPWWRFFDPPAGANWPPLDPTAAQDGRRAIMDELSAIVASSLFDRAGRDLESMGIATIELVGRHGASLGLDEDVSRGVITNVIRVLGQNKLFVGIKTRSATTPPRGG